MGIKLNRVWHGVQYCKLVSGRCGLGSWRVQRCSGAVWCEEVQDGVDRCQWGARLVWVCVVESGGMWCGRVLAGVDGCGYIKVVVVADSPRAIWDLINFKNKGPKLQLLSCSA